MSCLTRYAQNKMYQGVSQLCSDFGEGWMPVYIVQEGDILSCLVENFYGTTAQGAINAFAGWNCMTPSDPLEIGTPLVLPNGMFLFDSDTGECYEYYLNYDYVWTESDATAIDATTCFTSGSCCDGISNGSFGIGMNYNYGYGSLGCIPNFTCGC